MTMVMKVVTRSKRTIYALQSNANHRIYEGGDYWDQGEGVFIDTAGNFYAHPESDSGFFAELAEYHITFWPIFPIYQEHAGDDNWLQRVRQGQWYDSKRNVLYARQGFIHYVNIDMRESTVFEYSLDIAINPGMLTLEPTLDTLVALRRIAREEALPRKRKAPEFVPRSRSRKIRERDRQVSAFVTAQAPLDASAVVLNAVRAEVDARMEALIIGGTQ